MKIVRPLCIVMLIFLMSHTSLAQERYQTVNQEELYRLIGEWKVDSNERELYSTLRFFVHFSSSVSGIKLGTLWSIFQDKKRQPLPLVTEYALKEGCYYLHNEFYFNYALVCVELNEEYNKMKITLKPQDKTDQIEERVFYYDRIVFGQDQNSRTYRMR
jgi:hypothetical protein